MLKSESLSSDSVQEIFSWIHPTNILSSVSSSISFPLIKSVFCDSILFIFFVMTWLPMSGLFVAWLSRLLAGFKLILKFHGWICKWRNKKSTRNRNNSFHIAAYFERCNLLKYLEINCSLISTQLHQVSLYIEQCKTPWQLRNFEPEQIWSDHTSTLQMIVESYSYWTSMVLMLKKKRIRIERPWRNIYVSVQFSHSVMCNSLRPHGLQHATHPCPSATPRVFSNSCSLSQWCHPTFSASVVTFSCCRQSFPASGFYQMSQFSISGGQNWSFRFISPSNEYSGLISFRMDWLDLLEDHGTLKSLLQEHSLKASILWCSAFFTVQLSYPYMTTEKIIALTRQTFAGRVM